MLKKEFIDIIPNSILLISIFLIIHLTYIIKNISFTLIFRRSGATGGENLISSHQIELLLMAFVITLITINLGSGFFRSERKNSAFEYLFSSPLSKKEIFLFKLIPRISVILIYILIYTLIFERFINFDNMVRSAIPKLLHPATFTLFTLMIFFISLAPSIFDSKNWIAISILFNLFSIIILPIGIKKILQGLSVVFKNNIGILSIFIGVFTIFIINIIAFYQAYRNFDISERSFAGNGYSLITLISQGILIFTSITILVL